MMQDASPDPSDRPAAASRSAGPPLRILLWSPAGAGLHYSGPGMTAYRMYAQAPPSRMAISLVHGRPDHDRLELFRDQVYLARARPTLLDQFRYVRAGRTWMHRHASEFDVVHGLQGFHSTVVPCLEAQRRGVPAAVKFAVHGVELAAKSGVRGLLRTAQRRRGLVAQLDAVIAISRDIADELLGYGIPDRIIARIPNGVDTKRFRPADDAERSATRARLGVRDMPTLLFVGAISGRKRPHLLVEAAALLARRGIELQILLVGPVQDEAYAKAMRDHAASASITDRVVWAGFAGDVSEHCRAADLFALPSSSEGLPNAMLEAMSSGLPPIGTRISGIVDLIEDGRNGRLVEPDAAEIADAIAAMLDDPCMAHAWGDAARRTILGGYGVEAVLDAHEALFRGLIAGRAPAEITPPLARMTA